MRDQPAFQITLRDYSVWRAVTTLLATSAVGVALAWAAAPGGPRNPAMLAAIAGVILGVAGLCLSQWRIPAMHLRWDQRAWQLSSSSSALDEPLGGSMLVCLDFGSWMLLRFVPEGRNGWRHASWLPAQRSACVGQWHELRCALYSTRSAAEGLAVKDR